LRLIDGFLAKKAAPSSTDMCSTSSIRLAAERHLERSLLNRTCSAAGDLDVGHELELRREPPSYSAYTLTAPGLVRCRALPN
jgi:hypothetical protein